MRQQSGTDRFATDVGHREIAMALGGNHMEPEKIYSVEQASQILGGTSVFTIYSWIKKKQIKVVRLGRRVFITESELKRIVTQGLSTRLPLK
jgi:excisionase family DNA binding protein